jgi:hypothetical protein
MNNRISSFIACVFAAALAFAPHASAEDKPKVIRIAYPGVGIGVPPSSTSKGCWRKSSSQMASA